MFISDAIDKFLTTMKEAPFLLSFISMERDSILRNHQFQTTNEVSKWLKQEYLSAAELIEDVVVMDEHLRVPNFVWDTLVHSTNSNEEEHEKSKISPKFLAEFHKLYCELTNSKKWILPTGTVVEDKMYAFAETCVVEHSSHHLILVLSDPCWIGVFTDTEIAYMKEFNKKSLPNLPVPLKNAFHLIARLNTAQSLADFCFDPSPSIITSPELYWIEESIRQIGANYIRKEVPARSESDLLNHVFRSLRTCFQKGDVTSRGGDKASYMSSERRNSNRTPATTEVLERKASGNKIDMIIVHGENREIGAVEAGLNDKGSKDTKNLEESNVKLSKTLKDMMKGLTISHSTKIRQFATVGIIVAGLKITHYILDSPGGYVGRMVETKTKGYPSVPALFPTEGIKLLKTLLKASILVDNTVEALLEPSADSDETDSEYESNPFQFAFSSNPIEKKKSPAKSISAASASSAASNNKRTNTNASSSSSSKNTKKIRLTLQSK